MSALCKHLFLICNKMNSLKFIHELFFTKTRILFMKGLTIMSMPSATSDCVSWLRTESVDY